jgi:hypothetical protein
MEEPEFEAAMSAMSTNRRLYPIHSQIPPDNCDSLPRRRTCDFVERFSVGWNVLQGEEVE